MSALPPIGLPRHLRVVDGPESDRLTVAELGPQDVGRIVCLRADRAAVIGPLESVPCESMTYGRAVLTIRIGRSTFTTHLHWADTIHLYPQGARVQITENQERRNDD